MDALREDETTRNSYKNYSNEELPTNSELQSGQALLSSSISSGTYQRGGNQYRGGYKGRGGHRQLSTNPYIPKPGNSSGIQKSSHYAAECFDCGEVGHLFMNCPLATEIKTAEQYQKGKEAWDKFKARKQNYYKERSRGNENSQSGIQGF